VRRAGLANYDEKRLRYIDGIRSTEVTDSHGRKTVYQHNPSGQAIRVVNPDGGILTTEYDDHGRIVANTDAMGAKTRYAYDNLGNSCLVVDALGHATSLRFNDQHLATTLIDGRGHTWSREIDAMNRVIASVDPLGNRWKFVHDADGNVAEIVDPLGATKQQCFVSGVLKSASDWMGHFTNYRFDAFGQVVERTGSLGETTQLRYDAMGNPIQVQFADGSNIVAAYDHAGNLVRFVDANGHQKTWRYGPCNRLAERIDAVGGRVQYRWGSEIGWLDQVINEAGETYDFIRDEQGRVVEEVTFDGVHRRYRYDRSERVVAFTNGCGETVQIERDAVGRVVAQMLPDGNHHRFAYDETGAMIEAVNADIAVRFERDPLGRISKEFQGEEWVTTQWDAPGNQTRIESSFGLVANWVYDGNGLPVQLMTPEMGQAITITRDFNGREIRRHMPGGVCLDQRFDLLGQLTHQQVVASDAASVDSIFQIGAGGEIVRRNYQYDRSGNLTKINDGHWGTTQIQLDPADRLIGVLRDRGDNESYCYDASGNLSGIVDNGGPRTVRQIIHGQAGRVTKNGETRYEYDLNGRRCTLYEGFAETADITHYRWNVLDRLASVRLSSGIVWEYRYDAIGRRVSKRVAAIDNLQESASNRSFLWSGSSIIGESCQTRPGTSVKNISWIYAPLSFDLIGSIQNGEYHSILLDHLGTPCEALDSRANLVWRRRLTTWGYPREKMAPTANSNRPPFECQFTFPGQYFDDESKLSQNYFRYYDPTTARYVNHDPIGIQGGTSLYTYPTNPFNWVDRFGLAKKCSKAAAKEAADLTKHLGYAEKYGKGGVKELENGRIRYYGEVQPAKKVGEMAGRRYVHEYDAATGWSRGWHETVDHAGNVRQVRPELNNGSKTHYQFDSNGKYTRSW
jgi:RHS repeat-associated protein